MAPSIALSECKKAKTLVSWCPQLLPFPLFQHAGVSLKCYACRGATLVSRVHLSFSPYIRECLHIMHDFSILLT